MLSLETITCLSCNGTPVTRSSRPADTIKVATIEGIYTLSRKADGSWQIASVALPDKHISSLTIEAHSGLFFAGAHDDGGLSVSHDLGATWQPRMTGIRHSNIYTVVAQQRGDQTIMFAGTEPAELYRSDDLGQNWRELDTMRQVPNTHLWMFPPPPHIAHCKNVAWHPDHPETLYVCVEQGALLKTTDNGETWTEIESYSDPVNDKFRHDCHRVLISPSNPERLFLVSGVGCYLSDNGGASWERVTDSSHRLGYPDAAFLDPREESVVYMGGPRWPPFGWRDNGMADASIMRSIDGGRTFAEWRNGLPTPVVGNIEAMGCHAHGDNVMLLAGTATGDVFVSENAGENWTLAVSGIPPISKAHHYRWFLSQEQRSVIDTRLKSRVAAKA